MLVAFQAVPLQPAILVGRLAVAATCSQKINVMVLAYTAIKAAKPEARPYKVMDEKGLDLADHSWQ